MSVDPSNSEPADPAASSVPPQVDELLASQDLAQAVENDEFKRFLDHIPVPIVISRLAGDDQRIVYANLAFGALSGQPLAEIEGKGWSILDSFRHEDDAQLTLGQAVLDGDDFLGTFFRERSDGTPVLIEAYASLVENDDDTANYRIAALVDVTARERSQREEFQRAVRDKDLLLKEIQHRVKNNLQLIIALIRLEARNGRDGSKTVDFDRLAGRIEAIRVLYKALEGPGQAQEIDLGQYVSQIATAAMGSYGLEGIRLELQVDCCPVSINIAMPAGLMVNEVMTNAFKHAFVGREVGTIAVQCVRENDSYRLVVADDGIGLTAGSEWPAPGKLSALILQSLRENAKATLGVESRPGEGMRVELVLRYAAKTH